MDIKEVREEKEKLENDLLNLIESFEKRTGTDVSNITINSDIIGYDWDNTKLKVQSINILVEI